MATTYRGATTDERTAEMLAAVNDLLPTIPFYPSQGSYNTSVGASGGTHSGGGAVDIKLNVAGRDLSDDEARQIESAMRRVGFAAWYRPAIAGLWPRHVHGIAIGCDDLASEAAQQVRDYKAGRDGLLPRGSNGLSLNPDTGTRAYVNTTWESFTPPAPTAPPAPVSVQEDDMAPRIITAYGPDDKSGGDDFLMLVTAEGKFVGLTTQAEVDLASRYVAFCSNPKDNSLYQSQIGMIRALLARAS